MGVEKVRQYLEKKNITYTYPSCRKVLRPLKFIAFPSGLLTFDKSQGDDILEITDRWGIPYAVAILTYYFAIDTEAFYDNEYMCDYLYLTVQNTRSMGLSTEILDKFLDVGLATLHRIPEATINNPIVGCPQYNYLFFKKFKNFSEIDQDIAYCQGFKKLKT